MNSILFVFLLPLYSQHLYPTIGRGLYRFLKFKNGGCQQCEQDYNFDIAACIDSGIAILYQDHHPGEQTCDDSGDPFRVRVEAWESDRLKVEAHSDRDCETDPDEIITLSKHTTRCLNDDYGYDWESGADACSFTWCSHTSQNCDGSGLASCITLAGQNCIVAWVESTYISRSYVRISDTVTRFYWHYTPDCTNRAGELDYISDGNCSPSPLGAYTMGWNNYDTCLNTVRPTEDPSVSPTPEPTGPSRNPTANPSGTPSAAPFTEPPTAVPSFSSPTFPPSVIPSFLPSRTPSSVPTNSPNAQPTIGPTIFQSPTTSPSVNPSLPPSENRVPTLSPSLSFPSSSPTLRACAQAQIATTGSSLLTIDEDASNWNSKDELTIVMTIPQRFTLSSIEFQGSTNSNGSYTNGQTDSIWSETETNCLKSLSGTLTWNQIMNGAVLLEFEESQTAQYVGYISTTLEENVAFQGDVVTRTSEFLTPFILTLETEVKVPMNFTWIVDEPDLVDIKNAFAVTTPDATTGRSHVTVNFTTYTSWPWQANTSYVLTDLDDVVFPDSEMLEIFATECFAEEKSHCVQQWHFTFEVDGVCSFSGEFSLRLPVAWDFLVRYFTATFNIDLDTACPQFVDRVPLQGTLVTYSDITMTTAQDRFYLDDIVYLRATLDNFAPLSYAEIDNIMVYQYDSEGNLITERNAAASPTFDVNVLTGVNADTPPNVLDIAVKLTADFLQANVDGVDTMFGVEIEVIYLKTAGFGTGRRMLGVQDGISKATATLDKWVHIFEKGCENPDRSIGSYVHIPCFNDPFKKAVQICERSGWTLVKNPCGSSGPIPVEVTLAAHSEKSYSRESIWIVFASISIIFLCAAICSLIAIWCVTSGGVKRDGKAFLLQK